ncbi:unnamed protein product [Tilletia laevis]|uniref:MIP18 family-like domain-containing protein n=2 Tax=Tilletia TaxID=13289 RepID=A0A177VHY2_9BASI|nr:hypothetical protein CF336_g62 [Tilletia laevis]KAE8265180.1 hypothetical protein A4X03_0g448 [Tilletia caries]CAD6967300.1 unnamed protein product [Tilletia controversa]KAE8208468.1 hypothetical protein CF335_g395 [Tilletia laevis]CAD6890680.1 unnamed protein product [Tilletia caries]
MTDKDNANPIIHAPTVVSSRARNGESSTAGRSAQWWRDPAAAELNGGLPSMGSGKNVGGLAGSGSTSLWLSQQDDDAEDLEDDEDDRMVEDGAGVNGSSRAGGKDREEIDSQEVFDLVRSISDPEHPLSLEQLAVVNSAHITVDEGDPDGGRQPRVKLEFTPTIPHCSMATLIGLSLRVRLLRALPPRYKVDISIRQGTHQSETQVNKQLNDKERVAAAMENGHLLTVVQNCLSTAHRRGMTEAQALEQADRMAAELGLVA